MGSDISSIFSILCNTAQYKFMLLRGSILYKEVDPKVDFSKQEEEILAFWEKMMYLKSR